MSTNINSPTPSSESGHRLIGNNHFFRDDRSQSSDRDDSSNHVLNHNLDVTQGHNNTNGNLAHSSSHHYYLQSNKLDVDDDSTPSTATVTGSSATLMAPTSNGNGTKKNSKKLPKITGLFSNNSHSKEDLDALNDQDREQLNSAVDGDDVKRTHSAGQSSLEDKIKGSKFKRSKNRSGNSKNYEESLQWQSLLTKYIADKKAIPMHELCKIECIGLRDASIKALKDDYNINDLVVPKESSHKRSFKKRISKKMKNNSGNDKADSTKIFSIPLSKVISNDEKYRQNEIDQLSLSQKPVYTKGNTEMNETQQVFASSSLGSPKVFRRSLIAALEINKDSKVSKLNQRNRGRDLSASSSGVTSPATERRSSILVEALTLPSSNERKFRQNNHQNFDEYVIHPPRIPLIVRKAIEFIEKNGLRAEGLFRVGSSKKKIKQICADFDNGQPIKFDESEHTAHDVISVFKDFFRYLPEPLLTRELYSSFLATRKLSPEDRKEALKLLCCILPIPNRDTLRALLAFLANVAENADDIVNDDGEKIPGNKMDISNLAKVMGPNILHKMKNVNQDFAVDSAERVDDTPMVIGVTEDLIELNSSLFEISTGHYRKSFLALLEREPASAVQLLNKKQKQLRRERESNELSNQSSKIKRDDSNQVETADRSELTASNLSLASSTNLSLKYSEITSTSQVTINSNYSSSESNQSDTQGQTIRRHHVDNRRPSLPLNQHQSAQVNQDKNALHLDLNTSINKSQKRYSISSPIIPINGTLRRLSERLNDFNPSSLTHNEFRESKSSLRPRSGSTNDISIMPTFCKQNGIGTPPQEHPNSNNNNGPNVKPNFQHQDIRQQTTHMWNQKYASSYGSSKSNFHHQQDGIRHQTMRSTNQEHTSNTTIVANATTSTTVTTTTNNNNNTNINTTSNNNNNVNHLVNDNNAMNLKNTNGGSNANTGSSNLNITPTFHAQNGKRQQQKANAANQDYNMDGSYTKTPSGNTGISRSQSINQRSSRDYSQGDHVLNNSLNSTSIKPHKPQRRRSLHYRNEKGDNYSNGNNMPQFERWNRSDLVDAQFSATSYKIHHDDRLPTASSNACQPPLAVPENGDIIHHRTPSHPQSQSQTIPNQNNDKSNYSFKTPPFPISRQYTSSHNFVDGEYGRARSSSNCESRNKFKRYINTTPLASSATSSSHFLAKSVENVFTMPAASDVSMTIERAPGLEAEVHLLITTPSKVTSTNDDAERDQEFFEKMHQFNVGNRKDMQHTSISLV